MSELNDVIGGDVVTASFTNQVKERSLMRYASAEARDASILAPVDGALAWLQDVDQITVYDDAVWRTVALADLFLPLSGGTITGQLVISDEVTVGLGNSGDPSINFVANPGLGFFLDAGVITSTAEMSATKMASTAGLGDTESLFRSMFIGGGPPASADEIVGNLWVDTVNFQLRRWEGAQWGVILQGVSP